MTTWPAIEISGAVAPRYRTELEGLIRYAISETPDAGEGTEVHARLRHVLGGGVSGVMYSDPHHDATMISARADATHVITLSIQHHRGAPDARPGLRIHLYSTVRPALYAADWREWVIFVAAHEAWHVHQSKRAARPGYTGPKFSEVEADDWGTAVLETWRAANGRPETQGAR